MNLEARVNKYDGDHGLKGFATVVIEGMFVIENLQIKESQGGELYVQFPSRKVKPYEDKQGNTKEYKELFYPISKDARSLIFKVVLDEFNEVSSEF